MCYNGAAYLKKKGLFDVSFWQSVLAFLGSSMKTPEPYGWFHILWFVLSFLAVIPLMRFAKNPIRVVFVTAAIVAVLEIYKQINYSFSYTDGISFDYQWYAFPFQFCSTPMYVGLLAGLTKPGKVRDSLCAYLATYALFAGFSVMVYPVSVFISTIGINVQTMICHGSMISVGIYLLCTGYVRPELKTLGKAVPVFVACLALAIGMNEIAYRTGLLAREEFNMFFVSPYCAPSLPVYSLVQTYVAYPWCLIIYILGFTAAAGLVLLAAMGIGKLFRKTQKQEVKI